MLILSRKVEEVVMIGGPGGLHPPIKVTVLEIRGGVARLGFEAAADVPIHRGEVWERIHASGEAPPTPEGPGAAE